MAFRVMYYFLLLKSTTEKTTTWSTVGFEGVQVPSEMLWNATGFKLVQNENLFMFFKQKIGLITRLKTGI